LHAARLVEVGLRAGSVSLVKELVPGVQITSSLRLRRRLGGGGMGAVWVAAHLGLQIDVVVKFIAGEAHPTDGARFQREAAAAAMVRSPHVVQILDYGHTDLGTPYIAMELLEGKDLAAHLLEHGPMRPEHVVAVVKQVARALDRAHELGIVHRDVKPGNIFLCKSDDDEPFVKLLDFGVAKRGFASDLTATGDAIGTLHYMSPEQALDSKTADRTTDLWSLGVTAFELLTGKLPFGGGNAAVVAMAIIRGPIPSPSSLDPTLPAAVDEWFRHACERDRSKRFATARELALALETALSEVPPTIRDPRF
jgi:serine/threonine-protein kinase